MSDENLDIVDSNNILIGQEKRSIVHASGVWHRGVHIFLFTPERKLLVQQRSKAQDTFPGALDCSVSEHLRVGEAYLEGAQRGLQEELSLAPRPLQRLVQFRMNYGPGDNMINELYEGSVDPKTVRHDPKEIAGIQYFTLLELETLLKQVEMPFSRWFVQLLRWYTGKPTEMHILWSGESG